MTNTSVLDNSGNVFKPSLLDEDAIQLESLASRAVEIAQACKMVAVQRELMLFAMMLENDTITMVLNNLNLTDGKAHGTNLYHELYFRYETMIENGVSYEYESEIVHHIRNQRALLDENRDDDAAMASPVIDMDNDVLAHLKTNLSVLSKMAANGDSQDKMEEVRQGAWLATFLHMAGQTDVPEDPRCMHPRTELMHRYLFDESGEQYLPGLCACVGLDYYVPEAAKEAPTTGVVGFQFSGNTITTPEPAVAKKRHKKKQAVDVPVIQPRSDERPGLNS